MTTPDAIDDSFRFAWLRTMPVVGDLDPALGLPKTYNVPVGIALMLLMRTEPQAGHRVRLTLDQSDLSDHRLMTRLCDGAMTLVLGSSLPNDRRKNPAGKPRSPARMLVTHGGKKFWLKQVEIGALNVLAQMDFAIVAFQEGEYIHASNFFFLATKNATEITCGIFEKDRRKKVSKGAAKAFKKTTDERRRISIQLAKKLIEPHLPPAGMTIPDVVALEDKTRDEYETEAEKKDGDFHHKPYIDRGYRKTVTQALDELRPGSRRRKK